jgi:hypothetical protein
MFPAGQLVGDFIDFVRKKMEMDDLEALFLDDGLPNPSEKFEDWWSCDFIFQVVDTEVYTSYE